MSLTGKGLKNVNLYITACYTSVSGSGTSSVHFEREKNYEILARATYKIWHRLRVTSCMLLCPSTHVLDTAVYGLSLSSGTISYTNSAGLNNSTVPNSSTVYAMCEKINPQGNTSKYSTR